MNHVFKWGHENAGSPWKWGINRRQIWRTAAAAFLMFIENKEMVREGRLLIEEMRRGMQFMISQCQESKKKHIHQETFRYSTRCSIFVPDLECATAIHGRCANPHRICHLKLSLHQTRSISDTQSIGSDAGNVFFKPYHGQDIFCKISRQKCIAIEIKLKYVVPPTLKLKM